MELRSGLLAALLVTATVLLPVLVLVRLRGSAQARGWRRLLLRPALRERPTGMLPLGVRWLAIVTAQVLAVVTVLVLGNRELKLYLTWGDLFGSGIPSDQQHPQPVGPPAPPDAQRPHPVSNSLSETPSGARLVRMLVDGPVSGVRDEVLAWVPPAYFDPVNAHRSFPVVYLLSGTPGTPDGVYHQFDLDQVASRAVEAPGGEPFIVVLPPVTTHPPRDTECLDIPGGPRSESWLVADVPPAVERTLRVAPDHWHAVGFSTGGLCATNLLLRHPERWSAAVSLGGYFHPWAPKRDGDLFGGSEEFRRSVTPLWQVQHTTPRRLPLLIVTSTRDVASWDGSRPTDGDSRAMIEASRSWPGVASIVLPSGGHGFGTYVASLPPALEWLRHQDH